MRRSVAQDHHILPEGSREIPNSFRQFFVEAPLGENAREFKRFVNRYGLTGNQR